MTTTLNDTRPEAAVRDEEASGADLEPAPESRWRTRLRVLGGKLRREPGLVAAILVFAVAIAWSIAPGLFTPHDPITGDLTALLQPPSREHLFGTDSTGRDQFARVVHGSALSLAATLVAVLVGIGLGSLIGLLAGFLRGRFDAITMRIIDVLLSVPGLLLSLAIITAIGFGIVNVAIAVGLTSSASFARIMRAEVVKVATSTYVEAGFVYGGTRRHALFRHVLPNSVGPVLSLASLEFGTAVLAVSALSFLGFGATPPTPEWGSLVAEGRDLLSIAWWLTTFPGLVLVAVVVSANRISKAFEAGDR